MIFQALFQAEATVNLSQNSECKDIETPYVRRPHPSPLLALGLTLWAGLAFFLYYGRELPHELLLGVGLTGLGLVFFSLFLFRRKGFLLLTALLLGTGLAVLGASYELQKIQTRSITDPQEVVALSAILTTDTKEGVFGLSANATISLAGKNQQVRILFPNDTPHYLKGERLEVSGMLKGPSEPQQDYYEMNGLSGNLSAQSVTPPKDSSGFQWLLAPRRVAVDFFLDQKSSVADLMAALACGYRSGLDNTELYQQFQTCGLAHLVAVSGAHLSLVMTILETLLIHCFIPRSGRLAILGLVLGLYLLFSGWAISTLRAALMTVTALSSFFAGRRSSSLQALSLCIIAFLVLDPLCACSVSFALSAGATLGIILFSRLIASWLPSKQSFLRSYISEPLAMTLAANLTTLPLSAALFAQIPILGPLTNLVCALPFVIALGGSLFVALTALVSSTLARIVFSLMEFPLELLQFLVQNLSSVSFCCVPVDLSVPLALLLSFALAWALWRWWPQCLSVKSIISCGLAGLLGVALWAVVLETKEEVIMLDVGQGDAILIRSQGATLLIDTGNQDTLLKRALGRRGISSLDAVLITHSDDDHCGSLRALASVVTIDRIVVAEDALDCPCNSCTNLLSTAQSLGSPIVEGVHVGDQIQVGHFQFEVVWPERYTDEGGNADSLCLYGTYDGNNNGLSECELLFTGDAEAEELEAMSIWVPLETVDVLKVGHHGSASALSDSLMESLHPSHALIGVGAHNRYGHPTSKTLGYLQSQGTSVFRTDLQGDIVLSFTPATITTSVQKEGSDTASIA